MLLCVLLLLRGFCISNQHLHSSGARGFDLLCIQDASMSILLVMWALPTMCHTSWHGLFPAKQLWLSREAGLCCIACTCIRLAAGSWVTSGVRNMCMRFISFLCMLAVCRLGLCWLPACLRRPVKGEQFGGCCALLCRQVMCTASLLHAAEHC